MYVCDSGVVRGWVSRVGGEKDGSRDEDGLRVSEPS